MKQFIYTLLVCLFALTGCGTDEPGYGYKEPVVYFAKAGTVAAKGTEATVSVYCSGNPERKTITASVKVDAALYDSFAKKTEFKLLPSTAYSTTAWNVEIKKNEQTGMFPFSINKGSLPAGKYVLPFSLWQASDFEILKGKDILYITFVIE